MKQRIHPGNIEVKWGLGWIPSLSKPIKLWYVVVSGHTLASFTTNDDAWKWIDSRYEIDRHNG